MLISDDVVVLSRSDYDEFVNDSNFLQALQAAGVANWSGYDYAISILNGEDD